MNPEKVIEIFRKISKKALFPLTLLIYSLTIVFVSYTLGTKSVGERQNINDLNVNTSDVLSISDPLLIEKLANQCPQLPLELLDMALMFFDKSEKSTNKEAFYDYPKTVSGGDPWVKRKPNPFAKEREKERDAALSK